MSSKNKRSKSKSRHPEKNEAGSGKVPVSPPREGRQGQGSAAPAHANEIRSLISKGDVKSAVNRAKQMHKALGTEGSEAILVEAYTARILQMTEKGLTAEAEALLGLVRERYHLPDQWLAEIRTAGAARNGIGDAFLAPLNDPSAPPESRTAILNKIKEQVVDLNVLTASATLPSDHPIKVQAAAVIEAFKSVTSGPVSEEAIALPEVPRRSPLAPWKIVIKALFCFYRREDDLCERHLQSVEANSAPARLVPVIRAMLLGKPGANLLESAQALAGQVTGNPGKIRKSLQNLETALQGGRPQPIFSAIRNAIFVCTRYAPELLDRLRQHLSIRSWILGLDDNAIKKALGGPSIKNAYFWRLHARAAELKGEMFSACTMWNEFIQHAVHEGIFGSKGQEQSVVYLHMANLLSDRPEANFEWERANFQNRFNQSNGFSSYYKEQPKSVTEAVRGTRAAGRSLDFLYPERLYKLACDIAPTSEGFANWLEWMKKGPFLQKAIDEVAMAWHGAIPDDVRPLIHLARSAEERSAFKMCLGYLERAEQIDALNQDVRKIRRRILVATAIRHLKQRKPHLARKDLKEMEGLPLFQEGDRLAFLTALKLICEWIERDESELVERSSELKTLLGGELPAAMILNAILKSCGMPEEMSGLHLVEDHGPAKTDLVEVIARVCLLGDDMGTPVKISLWREKDVEEAFKSDPPTLAVPLLKAIGEAALRDRYFQLVYAISGAGLRGGDAASARFLLLRAQSLPPWKARRRERCIDAAIGLARRERDMDLLREAIEFRQGRDESASASPFFWSGRMDRSDLSMNSVKIDAILKEEREAIHYPPPDSFFDAPDDDDEEWDDNGDREDDDGWDEDEDDWEDDDEWDDDESDWEEDEAELEAMLEEGLPDFPPDIPPKALRLLLKIVMKYGNKRGDFPSPEELFKKEPELANELLSILGEAKRKGHFQDFGDTRSSSRGRGKDKKGAKKKGRR